jgi:hypothetical protein
MGRRVFIHPPVELGLSSTVVLELQKPLYGLPDAGDLWYSTFSGFITKNIGMDTLASDRSVFYKHDNNKILQGAIGTFVDDSFSAGSEEFERRTRATLKRFDSRDRVSNNFTFAGIAITRC